MKRIAKSIWPSFLIVFFSSFSIGYWIKAKQLNAISDRLLNHYPALWFATTIFQVFLVFIVLWLVLAVIIRSIDQSSKLDQILLISAAPFLIFLLPLFDATGTTLLIQAQLFSVMASIILLRAFSLISRIIITWLLDMAASIPHESNFFQCSQCFPWKAHGPS